MLRVTLGKKPSHHHLSHLLRPVCSELTTIIILLSFYANLNNSERKVSKKVTKIYAEKKKYCRAGSNNFGTLLKVSKHKELDVVTIDICYFE